jgi:hypothetical protein
MPHQIIISAINPDRLYSYAPQVVCTRKIPKAIMLKAIMSCEEAARRASRALDEPIGVLDRLMLNAHLVMCAKCKNFIRQLAFLRKASQRYPEAIENDKQ